MPHDQEFLSAPNRVLSEDWTESSYWMLQLAHILPFLWLSAWAMQRWQNLQEQTLSIFENKHVWGHVSLSRNQRNCSWNTKSWETREAFLWLVLCCSNPITFSYLFSSYVFLFNFLQPLMVSGVGKPFPPLPLLSLFLPIPLSLLLSPLPRICCSFPFEFPLILPL